MLLRVVTEQTLNEVYSLLEFSGRKIDLPRVHTARAHQLRSDPWQHCPILLVQLNTPGLAPYPSSFSKKKMTCEVVRPYGVDKKKIKETLGHRDLMRIVGMSS